MKRKAYVVPAVNVQTITIQHMVCGSVKSIGGNAGVTKGEDDIEPVGGGDSRRKSMWDEEEEDNY